MALNAGEVRSGGAGVIDSDGYQVVKGTTFDATIALAAQTSATATLTNVSATTGSVALFAANTAALRRVVFNDSTTTLNVKFGTGASATSFTNQVAAGAYYELPNPTYTGAVHGIWAAGTGAARTTELSA